MTNQALAYADTPDNSAEQQKLYRIASAQKWAIWAVLTQLLLVAVMMVCGAIQINFPMLIVNIILVLFQLWAIYNLATSMENRLAWLLTLGTLVPLLGLILLLATNGAATKYLQQAGINVGFMGVKREIIENLKAVR